MESVLNKTGPWTLAHFASDSVECTCGYVFSEEYGTVAEVFFIKPEDHRHSWRPLEDEAVYHARLIQGAPDLYRLLNHLIDNREDVETWTDARMLVNYVAKGGDYPDV